MMIDLQKQIYDNHYYANLYIQSLDQHDIKPYEIERGSIYDSEIIEMCNDFWESLPDSMEIHGETFDLLCEICTSDYNED